MESTLSIPSGLGATDQPERVFQPVSVMILLDEHLPAGWLSIGWSDPDVEIRKFHSAWTKNTSLVITFVS